MDVTLLPRRVHRVVAALVFLGLFVLSPLVRGDESHDEVHRLREEAEQAVDQGRLGEALTIYEKLFAAFGYVYVWMRATRDAPRIAWSGCEMPTYT